MKISLNKENKKLIKLRGVQNVLGLKKLHFKTNIALLVITKTLNNLFFTVRRGNSVLFKTSVGMLKIKGFIRSLRLSTVYFEYVVEQIIKFLKIKSVRDLSLIFKGPFNFLNKSILHYFLKFRKKFKKYGIRLKVLNVRILYGVAHNGVRFPSRRRT